MKKAVSRSLKHKQEKPSDLLGVDKKSIAKGHKYMTLIYNLDNSVVEFVTEGRKTDSLKQYYCKFEKEQLARIKAVVMDMWGPFIKVTQSYLGKQKIVIDRFHVMKHLNRSVDTVRKQENRELINRGEKVLNGSKYLWLYSQENLPASKVENFSNLVKRQATESR